MKQTRKRRAQAAVRRALLRGQISRALSCERCGMSNIRLEGHHPDYDKPLEVKWLCNPCHSRIHGNGYMPYPQEHGELPVQEEAAS